MTRPPRHHVKVAILAILALLVFAVVIGGLLAYRGHRHARQNARALVMTHLKAVGEGDVDAAMKHYGEEVLHGFHASPASIRSGLMRLRGLRRCEEYCAYGSASRGARGIGWYSHITYYTAYSNQPPNMGYKEMFEVFRPLFGTNSVIISHGYD